MRNLIILALLLYITDSIAATISFSTACSSKPIKTVKIDSGEQLGISTINALESLGVQFDANEQGLQKLFGLNSSGVYEFNTDDPELSENQMRVYGWCYEVDGKILPYLPHQYTVQESDNVHWFYGYVFYDSGEWGEMCQKASELKPAFLCGE
jgi:hypothetical protein